MTDSLIEVRVSKHNLQQTNRCLTKDIEIVEHGWTLLVICVRHVRVDVISARDGMIIGELSSWLCYHSLA